MCRSVATELWNCLVDRIVELDGSVASELVQNAARVGLQSCSHAY